MLFVIEAKDKPDGLEVRMATRPAHLAYLKGLGDALVLAGPFQDEGGKPVGSLVIVNAGSQTEAEAIAADDPYVGAGLFETSSVRPWVWAINTPEGLLS